MQSVCKLRRLLPELDDRYAHYDEVPCGIETFIKSPEYLDAAEDCWDNVVDELKEIFNENPLKDNFSTYKEVVELWGIGSGKSFLISVSKAYIVYRLQCYKNPQAMYGLARNSEIALINTSKTGPQAKKVVFGEIGNRIQNSPWFQTYCKPDKNIKSELRFPKDIIIFPGSSAAAAALGYTVISGTIDEAAFFTVTDDHDIAEEAYDGLDRRIVGRFSGKGLLFIISSPQYKDDFIERKIKESETNKNIRGVRRPVWENRPDDIQEIESGKTFQLKNPATGVKTDIPIKYKDTFERNPAKAWRDFGAVPSEVLEPYMSEREIDNLRCSMEQSGLPVVIADNQWTGNTLPKHAIYNAHFDLAVSRDKCGFAMGHYDQGMVNIDVILRIVCEQQAIKMRKNNEPYDLICGKEQINFEECRQIVYTLCEKGYNIRKVTYDQFQSVDSRQILESKGFVAGLLSVDKDMIAYDTMKSLINTNRLSSVNHPHALAEARRLELIQGKKVDHPPKFSKDLTDAMAAVCRTIMEDFDAPMEYEETEHDNSYDVQVTEII